MPWLRMMLLYTTSIWTRSTHLKVNRRQIMENQRIKCINHQKLATKGLFFAGLLKILLSGPSCYCYTIPPQNGLFDENMKKHSFWRRQEITVFSLHQDLVIYIRTYIRNALSTQESWNLVDQLSSATDTAEGDSKSSRLVKACEALRLLLFYF